jgi:5-methylcytosine-specific restriction endonuclease McrA
MILSAKYPRNWPKVTYVLKRSVHFRCERCGQKKGNHYFKQLTVHHQGVPYADGRPGNPRDKHDLRRENLVVLCNKCHDEVEPKRKKYRNRDKKRVSKVAKHRALGVGTGLVVVA